MQILERAKILQPSSPLLFSISFSFHIHTFPSYFTNQRWLLVRLVLGAFLVQLKHLFAFLYFPKPPNTTCLFACLSHVKYLKPTKLLQLKHLNHSNSSASKAKQLILDGRQIDVDGNATGLRLSKRGRTKKRGKTWLVDGFLAIVLLGWYTLHSCDMVFNLFGVD